MKKLITICFFAFALLFTSQGFAQLQSNDYTDMSSVKDEVKSVSLALGLTMEQTDALAELYMKREKAMKPSATNAKSIDKASLNKKFNEAVERLLTKAQFEKFKSMSKG